MSALPPDTTDFLHIAHIGKPDDDGEEDDWSDDHFDQLDEDITKYFKLNPESRKKLTDQNPDDDRDQHLYGQIFKVDFHSTPLFCS